MAAVGIIKSGIPRLVKASQMLRKPNALIPTRVYKDISPLTAAYPLANYYGKPASSTHYRSSSSKLLIHQYASKLGCQGLAQKLVASQNKQPKDKKSIPADLTHNDRDSDSTHYSKYLLNEIHNSCERIKNDIIINNNTDKIIMDTLAVYKVIDKCINILKNGKKIKDLIHLRLERNNLTELINKNMHILVQDNSNHLHIPQRNYSSPTIKKIHIEKKSKISHTEKMKAINKLKHYITLHKKEQLLTTIQKIETKLSIEEKTQINLGSENDKIDNTLYIRINNCNKMIQKRISELEERFNLLFLEPHGNTIIEEQEAINTIIVEMKTTIRKYYESEPKTNTENFFMGNEIKKLNEIQEHLLLINTPPVIECVEKLISGDNIIDLEIATRILDNHILDIEINKEKKSSSYTYQVKKIEELIDKIEEKKIKPLLKEEQLQEAEQSLNERTNTIGNLVSYIYTNKKSCIKNTPNLMKEISTIVHEIQKSNNQNLKKHTHKKTTNSTISQIIKLTIDSMNTKLLEIQKEIEKESNSLENLKKSGTSNSTIGWKREIASRLNKVRA